MNLPGRLRLTTLGDVLGAVYRDGATGVIELTEAHGAGAGRVHRIHVQGGLVVEVETPLGTARLGEVLYRCGLLDREGLARLAARIALCPERRAGEILVSDRRVSEADVAFALKLQRKERLERLFLLGDARVAFRVARSPAVGVLPLATDEVLRGRRRFRDGRAGDGFRVEPASPRRHDPVRSRALSTLGLSDVADPASVQRAFRRLAVAMHPDRFPTASVAERADLMRKFAEITAAYHSLVA